MNVKLSWIEKLTRHWSIKTKIASGYGLVAGCAIMGMLIGSGAGLFYEARAKKIAQQGHKQGIHLQALQTAVLQARTHQQQLIPLLQQSEVFAQEYTHFQTYITHINRLIADSNLSKREIEVEGLDEFIQAYQNTPQVYAAQLEKVLATIDIQSLGSAELLQAQQALIDFSNSQIALEFDQLSDKLTQLSKQAFEHEEEAEITLEQSMLIHIQLIAISAIISAALAIFLSYYTTIAIAHPLQSVTKFAKTLTHETDFKQQFSVTTTDEVGVLANSLNQLITKVQQLLESQKQEQETQLLESEKMSSLGRMLAGVAHEINNPVNFIYGNISHANDYIQDLLDLLEIYEQEMSNPPPTVQEKAEEVDIDFLKEDLPKIFQSMQFGADRIRQIVLSLKDFSRLDEATPHVVDIQVCLDSTLLILQNRTKQNIQIIRNYGNLPPIYSYAGLLYQVFMNLLVNAIDALEESQVENQKKILTITTELGEDNWNIIKITDNGVGISPENLTKIFDNFFTTKPRGIGTGLGLAISRKIIEQQGGKITCQSCLGAGTEFTILFPIQPILTPEKSLSPIVQLT